MIPFSESLDNSENQYFGYMKFLWMHHFVFEKLRSPSMIDSEGMKIYPRCETFSTVQGIILIPGIDSVSLGENVIRRTDLGKDLYSPKRQDTSKKNERQVSVS